MFTLTPLPEHTLPLAWGQALTPGMVWTDVHF